MHRPGEDKSLSSPATLSVAPPQKLELEEVSDILVHGLSFQEQVLSQR